ncbi:Calcium-transporting ATPase [Plasmodiophora brassicae]
MVDDAWARSVPDVLRAFDHVDPLVGLPADRRARQARVFGYNQMLPPKPKPFVSLVLKQFQDILVLVLLGAASVSFLLALFDVQRESSAFVEPVVILLILVANATVGVWQETNAETAIASLKELEAEHAKLVLNGALKVVPASDLVPGDIVHVDTGDKVPADCRIVSITSSTLLVDESSLTGESENVNKCTDPVNVIAAVDQDKKNMLFSSTLVTRGHAIAVVVQTGSRTSIGKIQMGLSEGEEDKTPLQCKLNEFGAMLSKMIGVICLLVWVINVGHFTDPEFGGTLAGAVHFFKIAIALAVAAIPEGLPAVVTTCLALGTRKMAQHNAIVRRLASVETLGCTSVICSDKTGTLTTNEMTVRHVMTVAVDGSTGRFEPELFTVTGDGWSPVGQVMTASGRVLNDPALTNAGLSNIGRVSALCNQAILEYNAGRRSFSKVGESTEAALKVLSEKISVPEHLATSVSYDFAHRFWNERHQVQSVLDFDRNRKSMSVAVTGPDGLLLLVKGAPESILPRCAHVLASSGSCTDMTADLHDVVLQQMRKYASNGMRCLALAMKSDPVLSADPDQFASVEQGLTFVGMVAMLDPPRPGVRDAVRRCATAGVRVVVVTGDNVHTASAICLRIGVFHSTDEVADRCVTGGQFSAMTPAQQALCVTHCRLFARVEPAHKQRLVELFKEQGHVVAMTGDGVNDAPALRRADIGIAMGSGTAVAREACDMVLQDDNFTTIVDAVEQGRAIFSNTRAFIRYLISSNIGEVFAIFLTSVTGLPEALLPVQLLWVNLVTDGLPATALGFNPPDGDLMANPPRSRDEPIVSSWHMTRYVVIGSYIGLATIAGFVWWFLYAPSGPQITLAQLGAYHACEAHPDAFAGVDCAVFRSHAPGTVALSVLVAIEMFNALNALSEDQSLLVVRPTSNAWVLLAIAVSMLLHLAIMYTSWLAAIFSVVPLSAAEWRAVLLISLPVVVIDEALKWSSRNSAWLEHMMHVRLGRQIRYRRFSHEVNDDVEIERLVAHHVLDKSEHAMEFELEDPTAYAPTRSR